MENKIIENKNYKVSNKILHELQKVKNNYNRKISRVQKKDDYGIYYTPERTTVDEILKVAKNGYDVRREINKMKSYLKRNAEKQSENPNLSNFEYEQMIKKQRKVVKNLREEIKFFKETDVKEYGKNLNVKRGVVSENQLRAKELTLAKARKKIKNLSQNELKQIEKFYNNQLSPLNYRLEILKDNYIQMIENLGKQAGVEPEIRNELIDKIMSMNAKDFYNFYNSEEGARILMSSYGVRRNNSKKGVPYNDKQRTDDYYKFIKLNNNFKGE